MRTAELRLLPAQSVLSVRLVRATLILFAALGLTASPAAADEQRAPRFGVAIYAGVTSLSPELLNDGINETNDITNAIFGIAPIEEISATAIFQAEGRFFISDKLVAVMGAGSMRANSQLDLMPQPGTDIVIQGRVRSIPLHAGLDYYFLPYTRGDFTLRPFAGGGFMSTIDTRVKVGAGYTDPDTTIDQFQRAVGNGAGFYLEGGVHAMIPSRYSFIVNLFYRNVQVRRLYTEDAEGNIQGLLLDENGNPAKLDLSGFGIRLGVNIGLLNRF